MPMQEKDQMCENLVRKMTTGESLGDAEKAHLAVCEGCLAEIIRILDELGTKKPHGSGMTPSELNGDRAPARPEAKKAREHGRQVFEREFGITFSTP